MSIKTEYRMHFESGDGSAESPLEISASGEGHDFGVFLAQPDRAGGTEWIIAMARKEALELKAIRAVLTDTATAEEAAAMRAAS